MGPATAIEELLLHACLYDDRQRSRVRPDHARQSRRAQAGIRLARDCSFGQEQQGNPVSLPDFFRAMNGAGVIPFALLEADMVRTSGLIEKEAR